MKNEALAYIDYVQPLIFAMIENIKQRDATGIEQIPDSYIDAWQGYYDAYGHLREFLYWWDRLSYSYAEENYEDFSKALAETYLAWEDRSLKQTIIEVDTWYQNNIGLCVGVFE